MHQVPTSPVFVGKKLIWKSLKTTAFSVAKQRLADMIREHRAKVESVTAFANGEMNVGDATEVYLRKVQANVSLKPRSKDYREMMVDFIRRSWPALMETDVRKVTERDCESWLMRCQQQYAPTVVKTIAVPITRARAVSKHLGILSDAGNAFAKWRRRAP